MTIQNNDPHEYKTRLDSPRQAVEEQRKTLESIADSDLPAAWIAEELLALADDSGE